MPEGLEIKLDPLNPGQFFACCGLFELLSMDEPNLVSSFVLEPLRPRAARFRVDAVGVGELGRVLQCLQTAAATFPNEVVERPVRPAVIPYDGRELILDWWLDEFRDQTTNIKCWAGQVTTQRLFDELLPLLDAESTGDSVFAKPALTNSLFGVDPRSAWNTLDLGFSPNEHGVASTVFPAVEVLAAFGLQYFRPDSTNRSAVPYSLWKVPLPAAVARVAFSAPWDGLPADNYVFEISKRGQSYKYFSFARNAEKEANR